MMSQYDLVASETEIDVLPDEVLLHIFSYLTVSEIKWKIAFVSRRWNALSKNDSLITSLEFGPNLSTEVIIGVLRSASHLQTLRLYSRRDANEILGEVAVSNKKLLCLKISSQRESSRMADISTETVLHTLRSCPKLNKLVLKRANFDRPEQFFKEFALVLPKLRKVNFNHNIQLGTEALHDMVEGLHNLEDLRIYCLYFNRIGSVTPYQNAPVTLLTTKLGSTLTVLKLNMLGLTDSVMPFVSGCVLLRVLHLYRLISINDESFILVGSLPFLEKLVVTVPRAITAAGWAELLSMDNLSQLKLLTISNSSAVDDNIMRIIATKNKQLVSLGLPGCRKIGMSGATAVIQGCRKLRSLNFFSTRGCISDSFHLIPVYLAELELLIYKPVDKHSIDLANLFTGMENLTFSTSYRFMIYHKSSTKSNNTK
uniref:F-box/LRR-repeat protein 7 n=1 Tax=Lygus hesperus TaxID=30085 RepID=A0A0A9ZAR8_LYGHE